MLSLNFLVTPCFILTQCGIDFSIALFLQFAFNTLLSIYRSFTVNNLLKKQISLISAIGYCFFGTITQTLMTAMNKPPDSHSDSEDSDSSQPPPSTSHVRSPHSKPKSPTYQPNIKSKCLSLKNKNA